MSKKTLRIGIDGLKLSAQNHAGPEKYLMSTLEALRDLADPNVELILYLKPDISGQILAQFSSTTIQVRKIRKLLFWTQLSLAINILKDGVDLLYSTSYSTPILAAPFIKIVSFIHGLEFLADSKSPVRSFNMFVNTFITAHLSKKVIVPSEYVKKLLNKKLAVNPEKVEVIPEGVSSPLFENPNDEVFQEKYSIKLGEDGYFLAVSTLQPRKNYENLIKGYVDFAKSTKNPPTLAIVGANGWNYQAILDLPRTLGMESTVIFLGRVSDLELPALYKHAKAYINPSLEEGFGLPVLEAMISKTRCLLSDIEPFRSLCQEAIFFKPDSTLEIQKALTEADKITEKQLEKNYVIAKKFSWQASALKTLTVMKSCIKHF